MKKNKIFRKAMSLLLSVAIFVGTVSICLPYLKLDVGAAGTITTSDGTNETVTQESVVADSATAYSNYATNYLNGAGESTGIVIPGLDPNQDYVIQGMTYYPQKDWMLVTAYHNDGTYSSKVFCLDAKTGEFVAMLSFLNKDGSVNTDHGGGIAISENNLYYSCGDKDRKIAYAPLSALEGVQKGDHAVIQLVDEAEFYEVGSITSDGDTAYTAYVCYDQGYLWMGNFFDEGASLAGIGIAAMDYDAPATYEYHSMVFGYKLKGSSSAAEWGNLISGISDCRGYPSHAIALDNNIKDVQYAVVDDGKLYLSCSYGSGAGNSIRFGFGETSKLVVADIDLSAEPTVDVTISMDSANTIELFKKIKAHEITEYDNYDMMPMSEGLCIVNDLIFCTFESASNKYLNESSGLTSIGNCEKPVDVIWKIDPYALENQVKTIDTEALYYEKVNSLAEIKNGEEYLIVYESPEKDPVTQKNILYALDANGGYKHYRLSKRGVGKTAGYAGALGHPITEYSVEGNRMYLSNAEKDDVKNVRWELNSLGNGAYSIQSPDYYFVSYPNLYCDASTISMAADAVRGTNMQIMESGNGEGGFWISNGGAYFLWCNDGTVDSYNTAANNFYRGSASTMYSGVIEQPGTFHTDALNTSGSNILGSPILTGADSFYAHGVFHIYKRVIDNVASTYESRVYTDMKAALQADGTYTIDLETYAISPNHYEYVGERPTDFIVVMDTSASVSDANDATGIIHHTGDLKVGSLSKEVDTADDNGVGVSGYGFADSEAGEKIYFKHDDGKYYRIYLAVNTTKLKKVIGIITSFEQCYWAYYIADDGLYYVLPGSGGAISQKTAFTFSEFKANVDAATNYSARTTKTSNGNRRKTVAYSGDHYEFSAAAHDTDTALVTVKDAATKVVDQIAANGTDNRIAITQYGSSTSYLGSNGWASSGFTDAFWAANSTNVSNLKTQINNIASTTTQTDNSGIEFTAANSIMDNSGVNYTADGTRNVVIIFISDGTPGADANNDTANAANKVIAKAKTAKDKGAFVYTVVVGSAPSFDRRTYMDAVSSKYPAATSMNVLGGANVDGVEYVMNLSSCSPDYYLDFSSIVSRELVKNETVGIANLNSASVLCEELNDAFKPITDVNGNFVDGIKITCSLIPGDFDKVERFAFDESSAVVNPSGITVTPDSTDTNRLTISGYDYSTEYISMNKTGRKLRIRIEGVLANEEADITNTSINNTSSTAIYQTEGEYASGETFKYFPTEYFNIPTYNYVLDYALPMYDNDINGTLCSVDGGLNKQSTYKDSRETDNVALNFTNGNLDMTYELLSGEYTDAENRSFCLIKRDDGTYDWFRINIIPASNVLFEENRFTASTAGSLTKSNWVSDGSVIATYQTLSGDNDRYGYDSVYAENGAGYSNGTALKATVNSTTKRSETMTFSYTGTGFDLMAVCGANTGIQLVNIKDANGKIEKVFMVDTYYVDAENNYGELLKQVPIVNYTNAGGYGDYTVEVTAAYLSTAQGVTGGRNSLFNKAYTANDFLKDMGIPANAVEYVWYNDNSILNGGTGPVGEAVASNRATTASDVELDCYIDGIRVYNPLGDDSSLYLNSEKGASYYNIVNELASGEGDVITSDTGLFAYVVGALDADADGNIPTLSFGNYQSVGPQNEIYLQSATGAADSHAVAFNVTVPNADSRVMISLRAVDGATTAKIASGANAIEFAINTATEQYFDITPYLDIDTTTGKANVIVTNSGSGLLGVNNIKLVDATAQIVSSEDLLLMSNSLSIAPVTVEPNSYDYNAIVSEGTQPDVDEPTVDVPEVDEPTVDEPNDDKPTVDVPVVSDNIFTKIIAFFRNLFSSIFGK